MPAPFFDRVQETTTTTGTGNLTLAGASTNYVTFASVFAVNDPIAYAIVDSTNNAWEVGLAYLSGSTTLVRDKVYASTNSNNAVNLSAGTKTVFCDLPAFMLGAPSLGLSNAVAQGYAMP